MWIEFDGGLVNLDAYDKVYVRQDSRIDTIYKKQQFFDLIPEIESETYVLEEVYRLIIEKFNSRLSEKYLTKQEADTRFRQIKKLLLEK